MFALPVSFVYGKYSVRVKRNFFGKCEWECEPHGQRCETSETSETSGTSETNGTSGTGETSGTSGTGGTGGTGEGNCGTNLCQGGTDNYYQTFINKILIMNIETHYKELITQLVSACSYKKILENSSFHY